MSDGTQPGSPAPADYPPPPAYPPPPQPAPPAQPAVATPPQDAQPPKKRGPWLALGIGCGVLVLLAICGIVAFTLTLGGGGGKSDRKAAFERAEEHYTAAANSLAGLETASAKLEKSGDPSTMSKEFDASVTPIVEQASTELVAARREVEPLESSAARTAYLGSLDAADASLKQFSSMSKELKNIGQLGTDMNKLSSLLKGANSSLTKAMKSTENGSWNAGIAQATVAKKKYATAHTMLQAIDKEYPNLGFGELAREVQLRERAADLLIDACRAGKRGAQGPYSAAIDKFNSTAGKTGKADTPDFVDDPTLLLDKFMESYKAVTAKLVAADEEHSKAVQALEAGDY